MNAETDAQRRANAALAKSPAWDADPLALLRAECEYDPNEDCSVDSLIAYKDALEDRCRQLERTLGEMKEAD